MTALHTDLEVVLGFASVIPNNSATALALSKILANRSDDRIEFSNASSTTLIALTREKPTVWSKCVVGNIMLDVFSSTNRMMVLD